MGKKEYSLTQSDDCLVEGYYYCCCQHEVLASSFLPIITEYMHYGEHASFGSHDTYYISH